jgi:hypothetical protein
VSTGPSGPGSRKKALAIRRPRLLSGGAALGSPGPLSLTACSCASLLAPPIELAWREEAARRAGLTARLERLRYEWTPHDGLPDLPARLAFRAEADDEVFAELFRRVLAGTLDMRSRKRAEAIGPEAQARQDVEFCRANMHGERAWWRIARTPDGQIAGFGIPSRNTEWPVVGYLGVLPEHPRPRICGRDTRRDHPHPRRRS